MYQITDIKKLKNSTYLISVIVKDKTKAHVVSEETIIAFNLLSKTEISKEEYKKMLIQNDDFLLYEKAVHFIDFQMRTISEVKKHLRKSTKDEAKINNLIKKLKEQKFLNDDYFVKEFVTQKIEFDLYGPKYIKEKLIQKGIHYDLIDDHLIRFTDDMQFDKINVLIKKEVKFPIKKPYRKAYVSIKTKLINKGFSLPIVESAMSSNSDIIKESCLEDDLLKIEIEKLKVKYDITDYKNREKIIGKMLQKGFDYDKIKKHLS